jgi:ParB-like chromosome segregation protein Spo0J
VRSPRAQQPNLILRRIATEQPRPNRRNARQHSDRQIKQIARSIEAFGFVVPILIDQTDEIVAGHGRLAAAKLLGMKEIPAIQVEHLNEAQVKAYRIADNRLTDLSVWDDRVLAETLKELSQTEITFDLEATGFTIPEIDLRIEGFGAAAQEPDPADRLPELIEQAPVSRPGDLWRLGRHALLCHSALADAAYRQLLGDVRANMVFTDPPYNVVIDGHASGRGISHTGGPQSFEC